MSHAVVFTINGKEPVFITCNKLEEQLKQYQQNSVWDETFKQNIQNKILQIQQEKQKLMRMQSTNMNVLFAAQQKLDTLAKEIANISWNQELLNYVSRVEANQQAEIKQYLERYGYLAQLAIDELQKQNQVINGENVGYKIDEIRQKQLSKEQLEVFYQKASAFVDSLQINDNNLVYSLKSVILKYQTGQELSDFIAFCMAKKLENDNVNALAKKVLTSLQNIEGFKLINKPLLKLDEEGLIIKRFSLINKNNNQVDLIIDGNLRIKYKLGNYIGHACEKTTNLLLNDLQKQGYIIADKKIRRDISNDKPLYKAVFSQEKETNK